MNTQYQISNHGVRKFWIYWTFHLLSYLDLHGWMVIFLPFSVHFLHFPLFLSNEGGNRWIIDETSGFYGICQIFPEDLPKPS